MTELLAAWRLTMDIRRRLAAGRGRRLAATMTSVVCAGMLINASTAVAELLVYEPFDYPDGTVLHNLAPVRFNLTGTYQALGALPVQMLTTTSPGLDYGSLAGISSASGNRANNVPGMALADATVSLSHPVIVPIEGSIFWSSLLRFDDFGQTNQLANITFWDDVSGDALFFGEPAVGLRGIRVSADTLASGGTLISGRDNGFVDGDTLLLIGRYSSRPEPAMDSLELVVYDTADSVSLPASFDPSDPNAAFALAILGKDIDFGQITSISFTIRGANDNFIDELRIGSDYASVVPEPTTGSLLWFGLVGLVALWRIRSRPGGAGIPKRLPSSLEFMERKPWSDTLAIWRDSMTLRQSLASRMRLGMLIVAVLMVDPTASRAADCCDLPNGRCIGPIDQLSCVAEFGGTYGASLTCVNPQVACQGAAAVPAMTPSGWGVLGWTVAHRGDGRDPEASAHTDSVEHRVARWCAGALSGCGA
jgi:hypothetical protein